MQLGCWRSATSGRCRGCTDSEVGPAVRIRFPPATSPQTFGPAREIRVTPSAAVIHTKGARGPIENTVQMARTAKGFGCRPVVAIRAL
jgi:hypothetical protein